MMMVAVPVVIEVVLAKVGNIQIVMFGIIEIKFQMIQLILSRIVVNIAVTKVVSVLNGQITMRTSWASFVLFCEAG